MRAFLFAIVFIFLILPCMIVGAFVYVVVDSVRLGYDAGADLLRVMHE